MMMQFSIVTPSFRNSQWLKLCIPSIADQGVPLEHIVQDAGSDDGTLDWLPNDGRVKCFVEKDTGMYDAVNRGLRRARGELLAYLNCDEQYFPGALQRVMEFFRAHPEVEIVFADIVAVGAEGQFLCYRKVQSPRAPHILASGMLGTFTCATFFRRSVIEKHDLWFDSHYRDQGDADWVVRALRKRIPMAVLRHYTSAFTQTGANMNLAPNAQRERAEFRRAAPAWARVFRSLLNVHHKCRRALDGAYFQKPFSYSIYTRSSPNKRVGFYVATPTQRWRIS